MLRRSPPGPVQQESHLTWHEVWGPISSNFCSIPFLGLKNELPLSMTIFLKNGGKVKKQSQDQYEKAGEYLH